MEKKEIASLKKLARTGRDLMDIMSKYLKILEDAVNSATPVVQKSKPAQLKKAVVKAPAARKVPATQKAAEKPVVKSIAKPAAKPAAKKAAVAKPAAKPVVKQAEKPVAKAAAKPAAKPVVNAPVQPATKTRGRPAKVKK